MPPSKGSYVSHLLPKVAVWGGERMVDKRLREFEERAWLVPWGAAPRGNSCNLPGTSVSSPKLI